MKRVLAAEGRRLRKGTKDSRLAEQQTSDDGPPTQQRPRQNFEFHTKELNAFLGTNDVGSLREVVNTLLPEQHGDVAALLNVALEKGKLDPSDYYMQDDGAIVSGSTTSTNPSGATAAAEDGKEEEENDDDKKSVTAKEILSIIKDKSTKDAFLAMKIDAEFEGEDGEEVSTRVKKNGVETMNSDCLEKGVCTTLRLEIVGKRKGACMFLDDDGTYPEDEAYLELCRIGAIEFKPLSKSRLKKALKKAVAGVLNSDEYIQYTRQLVTTEPENPNLSIATNDFTKARVLVVAGESGAGKSRFAVGALSESPRTSLLRYSLKADDFDRAKAAQTEAQGVDKTETLRTFIELVTSELFHYELAEAPIYKAFRSASRVLNKDRNEWAFEKAKEMLDTAIANVGCPEVKRWYEAMDNADSASVKLDELVVVFDECGASPDFVAGIIAIARDRFLPHLSKLAKQVGLVLCGSGLEAVKIGTTRNKYVGSDPALTDVVIMKTTMLENLPENLQDLRRAIEKGVHARVLAENARMLTQGLIPVLLSDVIVQNAEDAQDLLCRRIAFGSFRYAMDCCVRQYVNLNALGSASADKRLQLLEHSFRYLMRSELRKIKDANTAAVRLLRGVNEEEDDEELFRIGLSTRDVERTSNALKYLACHGATHYPHKANGFAFEAVVAAHLERYFKAVHRIPVQLVELKHAWPPAAEKGAELNSRDIKEKLDKMAEEGVGDIKDIVTSIKDLINGCNNEEQPSKAALVLRQGAPDAQGADVLLFELEFENSKNCQLDLSVFRAEGWSTTKHSSSMVDAAKSIGIKTDGNATHQPQVGSAGYSFRATKRLLNEVEKGVKELQKWKVKSALKNRAIVVAYGHGDRSGTDTQGFAGISAEHQPELWTREMLQPTISALTVAPASGEEDPTSEGGKLGSGL